MTEFPLSRKYIDFINSVAGVRADFLEGTTASGKTTVGAGVKFMRMVSRSPKQQHIIASKTTGTAEKNIIQRENGILDLHRDAVYFGRGTADEKLPHLRFEGKTIYVLGYDNRDRWENVLGGQYGCVYIDEANTADIEFLRELSTRNDYLMMTLNPDDPKLPVYKEFVNRARPYRKYAGDVPREILEELKEEPVEGWRYWFFRFADNLSLTEEELRRKIEGAPKGTKLYRNKIQGLRGRATGLVFSGFDYKRHVIPAAQAEQYLQKQGEHFIQFSAGLDTAYSQKSPDTIAMSFLGITDRGRCVLLGERVFNNAALHTPLAPSDTVVQFIDFLEEMREQWGFARVGFIDSADQATLTEFGKYKRSHGCVYDAAPAWKKMKIIDRIMLQAGWLQHDQFQVVEGCAAFIGEMETYSWRPDRDNTPEDANDHMINSVQYAWIPYKSRIGGQVSESR